MWEGFLRSICQIGIFMICAQAIIHFKPNGSYGKYLKMLVSIMILVQVFLPVMNLFSAGWQQGMTEQMEWFDGQMEAGMEKARQAAVRTDEILSRMTLEEIKTQLYTENQDTSMAITDDINKINDGINADTGYNGQTSAISGQSQGEKGETSAVQPGAGERDGQRTAAGREPDASDGVNDGGNNGETGGNGSKTAGDGADAENGGVTERDKVRQDGAPQGVAGQDGASQGVTGQDGAPQGVAGQDGAGRESVSQEGALPNDGEIVIDRIKVEIGGRE